LVYALYDACDTPRRNPGYRDTLARENNKKFIFELINYFFQNQYPGIP
jgi:hypothetical protein